MVRLIDILAAGAVDASGEPLGSGKVYVYSAGTTAPKTVYQDWELTTPHKHPITLDAAGRAEVYTDARVKLSFFDADDNSLYSVDHVGISDGDIVTDDIADGAVGTTQIADGAITNDKIADGSIDGSKFDDDTIPNTVLTGANLESSASGSGPYNRSTNTYDDVTNLSVSFTATGGKDIDVYLKNEDAVNPSFVGLAQSNSAEGFLKLVRIDSGNNSVDVGIVTFQTSGSNAYKQTMAPGGVLFVDEDVAEDTYTYKLQAKGDGTTNTLVEYCKLVVEEK